MTPLPMLARPMDMVYGPPDPAGRMVPVGSSRPEMNAVWLAPSLTWRVSDWHVNPGPPGGPEHLPWKRQPPADPDQVTDPPTTTTR